MSLQELGIAIYASIRYYIDMDIQVPTSQAYTLMTARDRGNQWVLDAVSSARIPRGIEDFRGEGDIFG